MTRALNYAARARARAGGHGRARDRRVPAVAAVASRPPSPDPTDGQFLGRFARDRRVVGEAQADPAALLVDLDHGDVDQVAARQHVVDRVDPLPRFHVGDVEQAVGALDQLDEGAEGRRLDDFGGV